MCLQVLTVDTLCSIFPFSYHGTLVAIRDTSYKASVKEIFILILLFFSMKVP